MALGPVAGGVRGLESVTAEPLNDVQADRIFSTKDRPVLSVVATPIFSTKETPQVQSQRQFIETELAAWKCRKNRPPYPPGHCLNPAGRKEKGRQVFTGFQILRRAKCSECEKEIRKVAGYISATQLIELEKESNHVKIGIIKNILRKTVSRIDRELVGVRCAACGARREGLRAKAG